MHDRRIWRVFVESWQKAALAHADKLADETERRQRLESIKQRVEEAEQLVDDYRARQAAALRSFRALSRKLGIKAARPLPRCPTERPFPDSGGRYGNRHVTAEAGPCVECGGETGAGPIGWRRGNEPGPVCGDCLIKVDRRLTAVPLLANLMREAGALDLVSREHEVALMSLLLATVKAYELRTLGDLPIRQISPETCLGPLLAKLRASRKKAEAGDGDTAVSH